MSSTVPPPQAKRHAIVFVCQAGELEVKALLLAASLRRFLPRDVELIAAVPTPADVWGELSDDTRAQLLEFGATIVPIVNPIGTDYPIGNKLACIDVPTTAQRIVFLDSDMLCLRDIGDPACLRVPFAAKPADLRTFAGGADAWRPLYAAVGATLPELRLPTTVSGEFGLPYFNSGVIFVDNGVGFGRAWIDCARAIGNVAPMPAQRHWLDQVALPLAVHKLGLAYAALDERSNFPAHLKTLNGTPPFFCHYHWPRIVRREPTLLALVRDLARSHPRIARVIAAHRDWAQLIDGADGDAAPVVHAAATRRAAAQDRFVVAGIPGSGAGKLVHALARHGGAVLPHSEAVTATLAAGGPPRELAAAFERATPDRPPISPPGSALALLCRLGALQRAVPTARFVVCVRDPFATIAAWKAQPECFDAAIAWVAAHGPHWLDPVPLAQFERLAAIGAVAERRAAWWWWLAQRVLDHADGVTIVRGSTAARVARALIDGQDGALPERDDASGDDTLDATDHQAIRAICLQAAADLGVAR